ncbi:MAG: cell division protein ZapA [Marvinbryantia sp.]|uniref:cell division protein ZapA n=1 Tax=Marvinbryantia sp. TaxID=2496532 RepID=UPI0025F067FF|nr:cell division protein ZapA [uncultured Marvinbryantia sp.]
MSKKNQIQVVIDGKILVISGYESEEYIQRVSYYINSKLAEFKKMDSYRRQSDDRKNILMQLNIADDYFKAKKQVEILEDHIAARDKEIFDLKHNLMDMQRKLDELKKK